MGDHKVTQVPSAINQGTFQVRHGGVIGDTSQLLDMQSINVSERVKSYQSSLNSHLNNFGKCGNNISITSIGGGCKDEKVPKCSATTDAESLQQRTTAATAKDDGGRVAKAKAQWDKPVTDTGKSSASQHRHVTGSTPANHHIHGIKSSAIKVPTTTSSNSSTTFISTAPSGNSNTYSSSAIINSRNLSAKASALGILVFQPSSHLSGSDQIRGNAGNLGPRSVSAGNLSTVGTIDSSNTTSSTSTTGSTSPTTSPSSVRRRVSLLGENTISTNKTSVVKNQSPKPFTKDYGQSVNIVQFAQHSSGKAGILPGKTESKPAPTKPPKPVKPFTTTHRQVTTDHNLVKPASAGRKGYVCSNGVKLGPVTSLKLPKQKQLKVRTGSPKGVPDSPKSPRSPASPRSPVTPRSPAPGTRGRASFNLPTSSSLAKAKDRSPGRNLHKPTTSTTSTAKDTAPSKQHYSTKHGDKASHQHSDKMHGSTSLKTSTTTKMEPKNSVIIKGENIINTKKPGKGHRDNDDSSSHKVLKESPLRFESEKTSNDSEKVTVVDDHVPETIDKLRSELHEEEMKAASPRRIMTDNNIAACDNSKGKIDTKNINNVLKTFEDFKLRENVLQLDAKLEQENAKIRDIYFGKLEVEKEHNYAKLPPSTKKEIIEEIADANTAKTSVANFARVLQTDRGEIVYNVDKAARESKIIISANKNVSSLAAPNATQDCRNVKNVSASCTSSMLQSEEHKGDDTTKPGAVNLDPSTTGDDKGNTEARSEPCQVAGISAIVSSKIDEDENSNRLSFVTLKVGEYESKLPGLDHDNDKNIPKVNTSPASISTEKENYIKFVGYAKEPRDGTRNNEEPLLAHSTTSSEIADKETPLPCDQNVIKSELSESKDNSLPEDHLSEGELVSDPVLITVSAYSDTEENTNEADDECEDYESIVDKVLWTDDLDIDESNGDLIKIDSDEDEGPSSLASSIRMFFDAYEAQLRNQGTDNGNTSPSKMSNCSPPYIAGLSPVTSSHHLRLPGSTNGDRGLPGFRSRSNSRCNETILEERESQSSDDEAGSKSGLEGIPGSLRNIPGRLGSSQSDYTESSIFQSETSEEDSRTSIHLDDWWKTWTMGRQRKSQPKDDDNHDTSDLEKVKVITSKMNLSSRRPSTLAWKEKYLDKPPFLWNHVAGKPPILSPSGSDTELHEEQTVSGSSEWTDERVEKINEAISWIRTELVSIAIFSVTVPKG